LSEQKYQRRRNDDRRGKLVQYGPVCIWLGIESHAEISRVELDNDRSISAFNGMRYAKGLTLSEDSDL
jgi:hypothetical protein